MSRGPRVPHSPEEDLEFEGLKGALDELFGLAKKYRTSQEYRELLDFVARFRSYSAFNAMLVHVQMPQARFVLPAKQWARHYRRLPRESAQPLVMLQPMGPVMFGFDVSQTDGEALPESIEEPFAVRGEVTEKDLELLIYNSNRQGVQVHQRALGSHFGGYVRDADSPYHVVGMGLVQDGGRIMNLISGRVRVLAEVTINSSQAEAAKYATLVHELAHYFLGHVVDHPIWPARQTLGRDTRELEAESVSYMVCKRIGLETSAAKYLAGYLGDREEVPTIGLHRIFKAAQHIENMTKNVIPIPKCLSIEFNEHGGPQA